MTMISDSWERLAGDVHQMHEYRRQGPEPLRLEQRAEVFDMDFTRGQKHAPEMNAGWEPHEPVTDFPMYHEPPDLHNQSDMDALHTAGFWHHQEDRVWHRGTGDETGTEHFISHHPGYRLNGKLAPWHVTTEPEGDVGRSFGTAREAIGHADKETEALKREAAVFPHWTKLGAQWTGRAQHPDCGCSVMEMKQMSPDSRVQGWMVDHRPHGGRVRWKVTNGGVAQESGKSRTQAQAERDVLDAYDRVSGGQ